MDVNRYFKGYCVIEIAADVITDFVNQALAAGISLQDVFPIGEGVWHGRTAISSLRKLRIIAHKTGVYFRVIEKDGLFITVRKAKKRWYSLAVMVFTFLFLILSFQGVFGVRIEADRHIGQREKDKILSIAAAYGVAPHFFCDKSQWEEGAEAVLRGCPNLSWVGFQKDGVFITVKVITKATAKDKTAGFGNIVAKKDGVVRKIFVLRGEKTVECDTPVRQGDVLIGGEIQGLNEEGEASGNTATVHADGIVEGSVWYVAEATEPRTLVKKEATGAYSNRFYCFVPHDTLRLWGTETSPFADEVVKVKKYSVFQMPLFSSVIIKEVVPKKVIRSVGEMKAAAFAKGESAAKKKIPQNAKIVDVQREVLWASSEDIRIRVTVETYENLGCFQSFDADFSKSIE